jgi:hypothetical protein
MRERKDALDVSAIEGFESLTQSLDVRLRHRLPRQPDGFEGLAAITVAVHASDLSVAER